MMIGPPPAGENNDVVVASALDEIKKRQPAVINQLELVSDFTTKQTNDGPLLVRRVHRMNPSTILVEYYIAGQRCYLSHRHQQARHRGDKCCDGADICLA